MRFLILSLLLTCSLSVSSQTVRYSYKPLSSKGCDVYCSVSKQDTTYYIMVTIVSSNMTFLKETTMLLRTFDNKVLKLKGELINSSNQSGGGIVAGNVVIPISLINSAAQFVVTPQQIELLKSGVKKIRLSTIPIEHERTFKKDRIGKKLYEFYIEQRDKDDDF